MYERRKRIILDVLRNQGTVKVVDLTEILSVSDMTVRRDINTLAAEGLLRKVHGGAVVLTPLREEVTFASRQVEEPDKKHAIARLGITLLKESESVFLDGSTTTAELARLIPEERQNVVVTDSLSVLKDLSRCYGIELVVLGGTLSRDGNTLDGFLAMEGAKRVQVDCCIFSAGGFSLDGISNTGMVGFQVKKMMIAGARRCVLLADSLKYGKTGIMRICGWEDVDVLVTDSGLPSEAQEAIRAKGTEVLIAEMSQKGAS
jgi:DeoR family fructose operon transcriptional repressor